jgi:hypothetical protein
MSEDIWSRVACKDSEVGIGIKFRNLREREEKEEEDN